MAFTSPFFQGTQAQGIINSYLNAGGFSQPYTTASTNPYKVDVTPYVPPAAQPTPDTPNDIPNCEEMYPGEGRIYDPVLKACVLPTQNNNDNQPVEETYQGVGSVYSPEQNAFMNLGLGGSTAEDVQSYYGSGKLDFYGDGLTGLFKRFSPLSQLGIYLDKKKLENAGIIEKRDDGYYFAKGGNYFLADANKKFEDQLAKNNMMNFAQNVLGKSEEEAKAMADVTKRGDKADYIGNQVYKDNNANVTVNPFQSNYGATQIVSYGNNNNNNNSNSASNKMYTAKTQKFATPTKKYNTEFKGTGFIGGR
jgi:hypothetical protein